MRKISSRRAQCTGDRARIKCRLCARWEACGEAPAGFIVNVQLIDTRNNSRLWAEEYDRDLNDVFALQSEIAQKVADQLGANLSSTEKAAIAEPPTTDLVAYDAYLQAKELINDISFSSRQKEDLFQAVQLLEQAVARDPLFFDAYCQMAAAHDRMYFLGFDHSDGRLNCRKKQFSRFAVCAQDPERRI